MKSSRFHCIIISTLPLLLVLLLLIIIPEQDIQIARSLLMFSTTTTTTTSASKSHSSSCTLVSGDKDGMSKGLCIRSYKQYLTVGKAKLAMDRIIIL